MPTTDLLDPDKIKENLKTKRIGKKVLVYNCTSSTNDIAAQYARNKANDGLVIFAEQQSAGRGRAGSKWHTGHADSILCSILLTNYKYSTELLSLTAAVAVADAIGKVAHAEAKIKWPNDIMLNGKKVAGILLESTTSITRTDIVIPAKATIPNDNVIPAKLVPDSDRGAGIHNQFRSYIIGIGINCHQSRDSFPVELRTSATSIDIESHSIIDRNLLAKRLLTAIDHWLEMAEKNSSEIIDQWHKLSIQLGHRVALIFNGTKFTGNCIGIDPEKGLILQLDTGGVRFFPAAHSSIAK